VIVHLDGLGADSLEKAIRESRMPFVERLMRSEGYEINPLSVWHPVDDAFRASRDFLWRQL
jgi:hypothetical protein